MKHVLTGLMATAVLAAASFAQTPSPPRPATPQLAPYGILANNDANQDGMVTRLEYLESAIRRFVRMDANKDNQLTIEERNTERTPASGLQQLRPPPPGQRPTPGGADADGDGLESVAEYYFTAGRIYGRYDINGDGRVTADEIAPPPPPGAPPPPRN